MPDKENENSSSRGEDRSFRSEQEKARLNLEKINQYEQQLLNDTRFREYASSFSDYSVQNFIKEFASAKVRWTEWGDKYAKWKETDDLQWQEKAMEMLKEIQQKKLFDLQCLWRAEKIKLRGMEICYDFVYWEANIFGCPALPHINDEEAEIYLRTQKAKIESADNETVKASVLLNGETFKVIIRKNEERNFDTSCDYEDPDHVLCLPKTILFLQLLNSYGANYFDSIRNWDKEKNKLLEAYGYSLNDDLKGKFEFAYKEGKPFLRVLDINIKRVAAPIANVYVRPVVIPESKTQEQQEVIEEEIVKPSQKLGVVFNFTKKSYPQFVIDVILGEPNDSGDGFIGKTEKLDISRYVETDKLSE
ncbi:MAG: helicase SNF2, partial [Bacteroidota bacterium]